jgi:hypothetical protein
MTVAKATKMRMLLLTTGIIAYTKKHIRKCIKEKNVPMMVTGIDPMLIRSTISMISAEIIMHITNTDGTNMAVTVIDTTPG